MKRANIPPWFLAILLPAVLAVAAFAADKPVPMSDCATCHEDEAAAFAKGPHGRAMADRSPEILERACATCHGATQAHVDDPKKENVNRIPAPEACLSCHTQNAGFMALSTPGHERNGLKCLDCHVSGHAKPAAKKLLKAEPYELCGSCHAPEANAAKLPFAHREGSKPFACTACHSIHGTGKTGTLNQMGQVNGGACIACHTEKAGPFIFPHAPVRVGGCVQCHQPHGSVNAKMLTRNRTSDLCLECHTNVPNVNTWHNQARLSRQACTTCHVDIHGSNQKADFLAY